VTLQLTEEYKLPVGVIDHRAVIAHLRSVLNRFASKPEYSEFYIGIANNLEERLRQHKIKKPDYRLMCVIYEEQPNIVANSLHNLEREAIDTFRQGIIHPDTHQCLLRCGNEPRGSEAKIALYILVK
jgi:hypothetical protein